MRIIPVIDLMHGQVVRGIAGQRHTYQPIQSRLVASADPMAVARAFLREPDLPIASHDEVSRELKLLVDRREDLVAQRTSTINR